MHPSNNPELVGGLIILEKMREVTTRGYQITTRFPKAERFALANEIRESMKTITRLILEANKRYTKKTTMQLIDIELDILRELLILSSNLGYIQYKTHETFMRQVDEVGRLLGGWIRWDRERSKK